MINLSVPVIYHGIYDMREVLEVSRLYFPELMRWSIEDHDTDLILVDKDSDERVVVPPYHFALFPGGRPSVVSYDLVSVIAPPTPSVRVPNLVTDKDREDFLEKVIGGTSAEKFKNLPKIVFEGQNREFVYLDYYKDFVNSTTAERKKVQLFPGDTLFLYVHPGWEPFVRRYARGTPRIEYMPTSRTEKLTNVSAFDIIDTDVPIHKKDWTDIWKPK